MHMRTSTLALVSIASTLFLYACGPPEEDDPQTGACCTDDGCIQTTRENCNSQDGSFQADGSCSDLTCGGSPDAMGGDTADAGMTDVADPDADPADGGTGDGGPNDGGAEDAGDTGDTGTDTDDGGTGSNANFAAVTTSMEAGESTLHVASDPASGEFDDSLTESTTQLVLDQSGGRLFALDRQCSFGAEECPISAGRILDLQVEGGTPSIRRTLTLEEGVYNPHGVAYGAGSSETFVSAYSSTNLYPYGSEGMAMAPLDVGQFDAGSTETDKSPEASDLAVVGDYVVITMLRLEGGQTPSENSAVAVYDAANDSFVDQNQETDSLEALDLGAKNAKAGLGRAPDGPWAIAFTGQLPFEGTELDGKIARFELNSEGRASVGETIVTEETLGGDILDFTMVGASSGVALISTSDGRTFLHFDASGDSASTTELATYQGFQTALCRTPDASRVWVGGPTESGGEFVGYDASTGEPAETPALEVSGTKPSSCAVFEN